MRYYPIFLDIKDSKVVVVGGGEVAQRKVESLLECGADIFLIGEEITDKLKALIDTGKVHYLGQQYNDDALEGAILVIAATSDAELNRAVSKKAKARNILVNAVDQPEDCTFIVPSVLNRGDLLIAVSTSGKSPALAKKIREDLETLFDHSYGTYVELLGKIREAVLSAGLPQPENRKIFTSIVESEILEAISQNNWSRVMAVIQDKLPPEVKNTLDISDLLPKTEEG